MRGEPRFAIRNLNGSMDSFALYSAALGWSANIFTLASDMFPRRMVKRGVRFINIYNEGWDAHSDVAGNARSPGA